MSMGIFISCNVETPKIIGLLGHIDDYRRFIIPSVYVGYQEKTLPEPLDIWLDTGFQGELILREDIIRKLDPNIDISSLPKTRLRPVSLSRDLLYEAVREIVRHACGMELNIRDFNTLEEKLSRPEVPYLEKRIDAEIKIGRQSIIIPVEKCIIANIPWQALAGTEFAEKLGAELLILDFTRRRIYGVLHIS